MFIWFTNFLGGLFQFEALVNSKATKQLIWNFVSLHHIYLVKICSFNLCGQMDRASILGDAIEYLKELLQRINDLHNELESTPSGSSLTPSASFHPSTPTPSTLPSRIKEELCPSSLPSPNGQSARVETITCFKFLLYFFNIIYYFDFFSLVYNFFFH